LKSIQDLAGMRIVQSFDRRGQDALVQRLVDLFCEDPRAPKVVDRRVDPVQGYRAVHVVVFPQGIPVEIQVRTRWQHEWADLFEKLADRVGREIRYGEPPKRWLTPGELDALEPLEHSVFSVSYKVRLDAVSLAIAVADLISAVEVLAAVAPDSPLLDAARREVEQELASLRTHLEDL
jgi:hypothetical protein